MTGYDLVPYPVSERDKIIRESGDSKIMGLESGDFAQWGLKTPLSGEDLRDLRETLLLTNSPINKLTNSPTTHCPRKKMMVLRVFVRMVMSRNTFRCLI